MSKARSTNSQQESTGNSPLFSRPASHSVQRRYVHDNKFHLNGIGHCCTNTKFLKGIRLRETKANKICLYLQSVYAVQWGRLTNKRLLDGRVSLEQCTGSIREHEETASKADCTCQRRLSGNDVWVVYGNMAGKRVYVEGGSWTFQKQQIGMYTNVPS